MGSRNHDGLIGCECLGCGNHKNGCRRVQGELYRSRHPVTMRHFEGKTLCHYCLNRLLEFRGQRLYPDVIPLGVR